MLFAIASCVWLAGTKLSQYVDVIADRTGVGKAFAGALLLGGATSLPEIATTVTASLSGAAVLAGTNLFGGVVMQIVVLAGIDGCLMRGKALTFFSPQAALLMQGVLLILMIALATAALLPADIAYREGPIFDKLDPSIGLLGSLGIVVTCVYLWGILERRDRTILGMGIDSAIVLAVYCGGMTLFYFS